MTVRDGATFSIGSGATLSLGVSSLASSRATLNVESGGVFNANDLRVATFIGGTATVNIDGSGSRLVQSDGSVLVVGSDANALGTGTINVTNRGLLRSGNATISATGTLNLIDVGVYESLGSLTNRGVIDANGFIGTQTGFVNEGTLRVGNGFASFGASLVVNGGIELDAAGRLELGPAGGSNDLEFVRVDTGDASLGGELRFEGDDPLNDYAFLQPYNGGRAILGVDDIFNVGDSITGTFDTVTNHLLGDNTALAVTYETDNSVNVTRARVGDANLDGDVDVFEFHRWRRRPNPQLQPWHQHRRHLGATATSAATATSTSSSSPATATPSCCPPTSASAAPPTPVPWSPPARWLLVSALEEADAVANTVSGTYDPVHRRSRPRHRIRHRRHRPRIPLRRHPAARQPLRRPRRRAGHRHHHRLLRPHRARNRNL